MKLNGGFFSTQKEVETLAKKYRKGKIAYIYKLNNLYSWSTKVFDGNGTIIKIIGQ